VPSLESLCGSVNFAKLSTTGRVFTRPSQRADLTLDVVPTGEGARDFAEASANLRTCSSYDRFRISEQILPQLGDESVALRVEMTDPFGEIDVILFRRGDVLTTVVHRSIDRVDTTTTEQIAKETDAMLLRVRQEASPLPR
jgi:hypothetical protein